MTETRDRIRQVYKFLKDAAQLRQKPVRLLSEQPRLFWVDDLPNHPSIHLARPVIGEDSCDYLLRATRPALTRCPSPPEALKAWLNSDLDNPDVPAQVLPSINRTDPEQGTVTIPFESDLARVEAWNAWRVKRNQWADAERPSRQAMGVFEVLYALHAEMEREGEQMELLAADGHLAWQTTSSISGPVSINHPILLKRVEITFDASVPQFLVVDSDREPELYTTLIADLTEVNHASFKHRQDELSEGEYHPFGYEDTDAFLKALAQTLSPLGGQYLDDTSAIGSPGQDLCIWRKPVFVLRKRMLGLSNVIDAILEDLEDRQEFSPALLQIVGEDGKDWQNVGLGDGGEAENGQPHQGCPEEQDILLAREANAEQFEIVKRMDKRGALIVQGPPGTGKTHTIGNLMGHLLAQGKSVLVTSHTAKALRVLKQQVPEDLQPLCVSVLTTDADGRRQMEAAVNAINERMSRDNPETLLRQAEDKRQERAELIHRLNDRKKLLQRAIEGEYRPIQVGGKDYSPAEAARWVAANRQAHGWIPSPVCLGDPLPLTDAELAKLYTTNHLFTADDERDAGYSLPKLDSLPSEAVFTSMVHDYRALIGNSLAFGKEHWGNCSGSSEDLARILGDLEAEFSLKRGEGWQAYAIVAGEAGAHQMQPWEHLVDLIGKTAEAGAEALKHLHFRPELATDTPVVHQLETFRAILNHLAGGGGLGMVTLLTHGEWRKLINTVSVSSGRPDRREHFEALAAFANRAVLRDELGAVWDALIGSHDGPSFASLGAEPELACMPVTHDIRRWIAWYQQAWLPLARRLTDAGLRLQAILDAETRTASPISEYLVIEKVATRILPPILEPDIRRRRLKECEDGFDVYAKNVEALGEHALRGVARRLLDAVRERDADKYVSALEYLRRLYDILPQVRERAALISKLRVSAPAWAEALAARAPGHNVSEPPGSIPHAWAWRQLADELAERDKLDGPELQREIEQIQQTLRQVTTSLIDSQAWGRQLTKVQGQPSIRQALNGWLDTMKRLASTRKPHERQKLMTEARRLIKTSAAAVPAWIMTLSTLAESFDPRKTQFDVVIIDEASQADMSALVALYLGKQVVIVGDNEQVNPEAVGVNQGPLQHLIVTHLGGIPNAHLYDARQSIYDLGRQSFGQAIRLVEHFRCVPEIIEFSNHLSYNGTIRPLRESNSSSLKPACVALRVDGQAKNKVNQVEAKAVVNLVRAMIQHPAYAGKTIGVISLVGEEQAYLIENLIRKQVDPVELENRRVLCGNSASFQGDERDVMILSMIDSPSEDSDDLIRLKGEGAFESIKKRYNVAASRARDQMWVVHSLDPDSNLKPNDIRRQLLKHVADPLSRMRAIEQAEARAESEFERQVLNRLVSQGYRVKPQWKVGYYRIDIVVEGGSRRLAIECDGDRWHPLEKLSEDMERQAVLERLGWVFVRIRGSEFFRDPDGAMEIVFRKLQETEIPPELEAEAEIGPDMNLVDELKELMRANDLDLYEHAGSNPDPTAGTGDTGFELSGLDFSDDEIRLHIESLLKESGFRMHQAVLVRSVAARMGKQRLGRKIKESIEGSIRHLVSTGVLQMLDAHVEMTQRVGH